MGLSAAPSSLSPFTAGHPEAPLTGQSDLGRAKRLSCSSKRGLPPRLLFNLFLGLGGSVGPLRAQTLRRLRADMAIDRRSNY